MNLAKFEHKCGLAKMAIIGRADIEGFVVFTADGYSNGAAEFEAPHYRTVYAIGTSPDKLKLMQSIYHEFGKELGKKNLQDERIQDAFQQAQAAIGILKDGGILKH